MADESTVFIGDSGFEGLVSVDDFCFGEVVSSLSVMSTDPSDSSDLLLSSSELPVIAAVACSMRLWVFPTAGISLIFSADSFRKCL